MSTDTPNNGLSRRQRRDAAQHYLDNLQGNPFPNSRKLYLTGSRPDIRVGMREID